MALFDIHDQHKMKFPGIGIKESLKRIEGSHAHVGADSHNLTLPYGTVADSVNVEGYGVVKRGRNKLSASWVKANESKIDLLSAQKNFLGQNYKASDYKDQAKNDPKKAISLMTDAMVEGAITHVKKVHGEDVSVNAINFGVSHYWNTGSTWDSVRNSVKELNKEKPDLRSSAFVNYTQNTRTGEKHLFGLFKRRVSDLNSGLSATGKYSVIEAVQHNGRVYFNTYDNQGNLAFSWKKPKGTPMPSQPVIDLKTDAPPKRFNSQFTGDKSEAYKVYGK